MKTSTLIRIAAVIESIKGVSVRGSVNEVKARLVEAAKGCRSKADAAKAISDRVYNHPFNGDYPATEQAILDYVRGL